MAKKPDRQHAWRYCQRLSAPRALPLHRRRTSIQCYGDAQLRCPKFLSQMDSGYAWCPECDYWLCSKSVSYTHLRAHETRHDLVCRLLLEKKKKHKTQK